MTKARADARPRGNIEARGDSLRIRVYAGPDPVTGKPAWCQVVDAPPASTSLDKETVEDFGRFLPVECLSWTVVEFVGDGVEF
ncbi:MAG TPA: hypothetical protein VFW64_03695, partial [Pseudonocardiaceae bacterium]|nr:hypothetical protein [Pseudonocardiaceae bacterium]